MRTSYSALATFKQCPQRYKFKYIDKVHESKTREQVFGTFIHSCLEFMFTHEPIYPTLDQVLEYFNSNFPTDNWNAIEHDAYKEQGQTILKNFYKSNAPWNFVVIGLESRFEVTIEDILGKTVHILAGIMDRIDKRPDGRYEIIDYKTKKRLPPQAQVDRDLQLSIYAMGLQKRWPHLKASDILLSLSFLKHSETLSTTRTEEDFKRTESDVLQTVHEIEELQDGQKPFPPIVSPLCDFCGYKPLCPAWKHLYKNVAAEVIDGEKIEVITGEYFKNREIKSAAEKRLKELALLITRYLAQESIDRVFDEQGIIAKRTIEKYNYDFEEIRKVLEPLGKWQDILKADEVKLRAILNEIPDWAREEIKKARVLARSSIVLVASKLKKSSRIP